MDYRISQKEDGYTHIQLIGAMNEDAELALQHIASDIKEVTKTLFNFAQTTSVNSLGVRAWVQFLRGIGEGREITFEECSPDVIMQINMIPNFQSKATILSFFTNYVCEQCNATQKTLIDRRQLPAKTMPPKQKCQACSEEMETEELEDEYFAFLMR